MLGLKLIHVSNRGPDNGLVQKRCNSFVLHMEVIHFAPTALYMLHICIYKFLQIPR